MSEIFLIPLHGPTLTEEDRFYITLVFLVIPMFVAMSGVMVSKKVNLGTSLRAQILAPVGYVVLPTVTLALVFVLEPEIGETSFLVLSLLTVLAPPVLGFIQAVLTDTEQSAVYLVGFVLVLLGIWLVSMSAFAFEIEISMAFLMVSTAIYLILLAGLAVRSENVAIVERRIDASLVDSLLKPALLLTVIYSPVLVGTFFLIVLLLIS